MKTTKYRRNHGRGAGGSLRPVNALRNLNKIGVPVIVAVAAISALVFAPGPVQAQSVIGNGDFSSLNDWTVVVEGGYPNARYSYGVGPYTIFPEMGTAKSFSAQVGDPIQLNLEQTVSLSTGVQYNFSADVAAYYPTDDIDGGTITLSIDGNQVSSLSFGGDAMGSTIYGTLDGSYIPTQSGNELLILNFSRNFIADAYTPSDFITDISLVPVPEPSSTLVLGLGIFALALRRASLEGINRVIKGHNSSD